MAAVNPAQSLLSLKLIAWYMNTADRIKDKPKTSFKELVKMMVKADLELEKNR